MNDIIATEHDTAEAFSRSGPFEIWPISKNAPSVVSQSTSDATLPTGAAWGEYVINGCFDLYPFLILIHRTVLLAHGFKSSKRKSS